MNFMASSRRGFYEEGSKGVRPISQSSSSSSSSSSRQKGVGGGFIPFSYNHNHQQQRPAWLDNNYEDQQDQGGGGGGGRGEDRNSSFMFMSSPSPTNNNSNIIGAGSDDADKYSEENRHHHPHQFVIQSSSDGGSGAGQGGSSGTHQQEEEVIIEREHMFDKVVTPSDVGKLNRLVIPKQHAEKYFPLDSSTNEKGLLLNFEDRNGKPWRFRYSYWNSSQSYVMTKGWSRFVKEKKLDAGDIVSFQRGVGELGKDRLFIDWRRRPDAAPHHLHYPHHHDLPPPIPAFSVSSHFSFRPWNHHHHHPLYLSPQSHNSYGNSSNSLYGPGSVFYRVGAPQKQQQQEVGMLQFQRGGAEGSNMGIPMAAMPSTVVFESVPVVQGKAVAAKRLRLFGVNMECPISESDECDILSSTTVMPHSTIAAAAAVPHLHHRPNLSSSPSSIPSSNSLPLIRPYSSSSANDVPNKGKASSSMSLDLDI